MSKGSKMKLLGASTSPFSTGVRIALNKKSVDYEFLEETFGYPSQLLLQYNPVYKTIPVLIHGGKPICGMLIILEYIDEACSFGPPILPSDPYDRAFVRFWGAYVHDKLYQSIFGINAAQTEEARKEPIDKAKECLLWLEDAFGKCSQGKPFFGGEQIGYLDIVFGPFLGWLKVAEKTSGLKLLDEAKVPRLVKWAECFSSDPLVEGLMPEAEKLYELLQVSKAAGPPARPPK